MKTILTKIALAAGATLALPALALAATPFSNGSFENGPDGVPFVSVAAPDSTTIPGWTVDFGSVDYITTYWQAADGTRSLDLSGNERGSVSQTFDTVPGAIYTVTFSLSGNPDGGPLQKAVQVTANGGQSQTYTYDSGVTHNTRDNMAWQTETYSFVANTTSTKLQFASLVDGFYGPALDDVAVTLVTPTDKNQCKNGGWMTFVDASGNHFKNQGDCVSYVATQGKNTAAGN